MKKKSGRVLFCYTVVREFTENFEVDMARAFLDDIRNEGATDITITALENKNIAFWSEEDECGRSHHAVEIIEK